MQIHQPRIRKRIFYVPGLISLVLLPVFCYCYIYRLKPRTNLKTMVVAVPENAERLARFGKSDFWVCPKRDYEDLNITGDNIDDRIKLRYGQLEIQQIFAQKDTTKGVHFHFGDKSKYWALVRALDICKREKAQFYMLKDNDLWVPYTVPYVPVKDTLRKIKPIYL